MIAPSPLHLPACRCAWRHLALDCVTSTNDIALQQAEEGAAEGLVITARQQTKGRGRQGREWLAGYDDALLMSLLLRPDWLDVARAPQLSLLAAVALYHALDDIDGKRLKWPNDLLVDGRKLAGILTELRAPIAGRPPVVVVGIGVNLRPPSDGWPDQLRHPATALAALGVRCGAGELMRRIIPAFDACYTAYRDGGFGAIAEQWWRAHGGEQPVTVDEGGRKWRGRAVGLDDDGALLVHDGHGVRRVVAADVAPCDGEGDAADD